MKKNYKLVFGIIIGILISGRIVYGITESIIEGKNVIYENSESHGSYENVQDSIDELYRLSGIQSEEWKEEILKGNDPVLGETLTPVTIESNGDVYYANKNSKWYNYSEKRWANAVKLVPNPNKTYNTGDKIEEEDIESYFVWIPRYKYQLWNVDNYEIIDVSTLTNKSYDTTPKIYGNARIINIEFEPITENNPSSENSQNGEWITHPAFTLNDKQLKGIWVGKFETGYNQMANVGGPIDTDNWSTAGAQHNETYTTSRIIIKPNVYSWRGINVYNIFMNAYNYLREKYDSHMMKNTEWGAVAYLSHSAYGIGTEIRINNNSSQKTGYSTAANTDQSSYMGDSGIAATVTQPYNTPTGYLASTTGNITGIYDMSGGAEEYVAAYSKNIEKDSGFNDTDLNTYSGYFDKYPEDSTETSYGNRILGDATGEMGPFYNYYEKVGPLYYHNSWYSDVSGFTNLTYPWFGRGGPYSNGLLAGQYFFFNKAGNSITYVSFRLVLSPI